MSAPSTRFRTDALPLFFLLTFAFTWGIAACLVLFPTAVEALFGELSSFSPIFLLAVAGPTLVATFLTWKHAGWSGLKRLYGHLLRWRFGLRWYALLLVGIPLLGYLVAQVAGPEMVYDLATPMLLLLALVNLLVSGPLGEELGWRGFALPRLLNRFNPFIASLILGILWGIWHLPSFFLSGLPQSGLAIPIFLLGGLCLSILATWLFYHTDQSVLSIVLFHYMVNFSLSVLGAPLPAFTLVLVVAAVLVVALDRRLHWFGAASPNHPVWQSPSIPN